MIGALLPTSTRRALRALPAVWFVRDLGQLARMGATSRHLPDRTGERPPWVPSAARWVTGRPTAGADVRGSSRDR